MAGSTFAGSAAVSRRIICNNHKDVRPQRRTNSSRSHTADSGSPSGRARVATPTGMNGAASEVLVSRPSGVSTEHTRPPARSTRKSPASTTEFSALSIGRSCNRTVMHRVIVPSGYRDTAEGREDIVPAREGSARSESDAVLAEPTSRRAEHIGREGASPHARRARPANWRARVGRRTGSPGRRRDRYRNPQATHE